MKNSLLLCAFMLLPVTLGAEALKDWNYASLDDIRLSASPGNEASLRLSSDVKTPEGRNTLEIALKKLNPDAAPWDIQVKFLYADGLKAGRSYELSFLCQASVPGVMPMVAAQAEKPWDTVPDAASNPELSQEWRKIKMSFTAKKDWTEPLAILRLMLAQYGAPATLRLGPATLRELPKLLPLSLKKEWTLALGSAAPVKVALQGDTLDLARLAGSFKVKDCATLRNQFESSEPGRMRLGVSADWWMALQVNGEKVYDNLTTSDGNNSQAFVPDDHVVEFPVKAGSNLLTVQILAGSTGWRFVCGAATRPPDEPRAGLFTPLPGPDWKPVDMDKLAVKAGTALDFSELDGKRRPAGELGRVIVNADGKLAFEKAPEQAVRFLCYNSFLTETQLAVHTWTKQDIEDFAAAVARQGYTMLRFQGVDRFLLGIKVHWSRTPKLLTLAEAGIPQQAKDIQFDPDNFDRLDYIIACLKKNGVYVNMDLMTVGSGYSIAYPTKVPEESSFRVQLFFNPEYRRHWEAAISQLLNHVNPYTGLSWKDDPAIANLEPYNEQDLLIYNKDMMKVFTPYFRQSLKDKYQTDARLRSAWGQPDISFDQVPDIDEETLRRGDARAEDAGRFLIKTMSDTTQWYCGTLRRLGYRGLVTQWDMIMRTLEIPVRAQMPVIAQHSYFAHPHWVPTKNLVKKQAGKDQRNDIAITQESSIDSSFFRAAAAARFLDRPFIVTEHSHSAFNRYRHERGLYFSSYAALQGWDSLAVHGAMAAVKTATVEPFQTFDNAIDPISRASEAVAALAWARGDVKEAPHSVQLDLFDNAMFPRHFLAAVGDDYAKLAMLTKIGVAYQTKGKATLALPLTEFSPLRVNSWYATASAADGQLFPALLQKLKDGGVLSDSNRTDYARRLFQSETGEVTLDGKAGTLAVSCPRLEGAIIKKDVPVKLASLEVNSCSKPASVVVASLDRGKAIPDARRLLLVFSTNALNSGMVFENSSMALMAESGSLPVLMETAKLSLKLKSSQGVAPAVYALNLDGTGAEQIPCEFKEGVVSLDLDTAKLRRATPFFEIVFP